MPGWSMKREYLSFLPKTISNLENADDLFFFFFLILVLEQYEDYQTNTLQSVEIQVILGVAARKVE